MPPSIIFMGTPEFAVASLKALVESDARIIAVVTAPDKPAGRGMKLTESAVKKYALTQNIRVLQPEKLKNPEFIDTLKQLNADLQVVVAFRMLPEIVWNMPPMGTINVHGSLLPQYRGAAPINWAIINGEKETGVTTFRLKHEIDTGNILAREKLTIGENETAGELHDRMMMAGASLLVKTIEGISSNKLEEIPQDQSNSEELKHAPKIFTENCRIDFNQPTNQVHNLVRGLSPFPGAFTDLDGKILKIYRTEKELILHSDSPGSYKTDGNSVLKFACTDGYINVLELQLEGKKRITSTEFLKGYRFKTQP